MRSKEEEEFLKAVMCLVGEAEDVFEDGTQPRLAKCVADFWKAYEAYYGFSASPEGQRR